MRSKNDKERDTHVDVTSILRSIDDDLRIDCFRVPWETGAAPSLVVEGIIVIMVLCLPWSAKIFMKLSFWKTISVD